MSTIASDQSWSAVWQKTLQNLDLVSIGTKVDTRGRIRRLEVMDGMVSAEVQERNHGLCQVTIVFAPLEKQAWRQLHTVFRQHVAGTLQFDPKILFSDKEPTFSLVSALLLSFSTGEIHPDCSCCQAQEEHCPALQAVYRQIGALLNEEPVLLLRLRGKEWQAFAQELQQQRTASYPAVSVDSAQEEQSPQPIAVSQRDTAPEENALVAQSGYFWGSRRALETFHHHIAPPSIDLAILRRLGPLPGVLSDLLVDQELAVLYRHVTHKAETLAFDLDSDDPDSDKPVRDDLTDHTTDEHDAAYPKRSHR